MSSEILYALPGERVAHKVLQAVKKKFPVGEEPYEEGERSYYDTFDWRLEAKGLAAVRDGGEFRLLSGRTGGTLLREKLDREPGFAPTLPEKAGARLAPVMEMRALLPTVSVRYRRKRVAVLDGEEKTVARLVLEEATTLVKNRKKILGTWVSILPVRGYDKQPSKLEEILASAGLTPAPSLPYRMALGASGVVPGSYSSKPMVPLAPEERTDAAAKKILSRLLEVIKANEEGVKKDIDSEFLHDFRVAVRRTRSALGQIKGAFPEEVTQSFKEDFSYIGQATGPVRDLDVYLLKMEEYEAALPEILRENIKPMVAFLEKRQKEEQVRLARRLANAKYKGIIARWEAFLAEPCGDETGPNGKQPVLVTGKKRIYRSFERVLADGLAIHDETPPEALHRLRIDCKKLRYLLEFFTPLFPERRLKPLVKVLKGLQSVLGDFQDLEVQQHKLMGILDEMKKGGKVTSDTAMAVGALVESLNRRQWEARALFHERFEAFATPENRQEFAALFQIEKKKKEKTVAE